MEIKKWDQKKILPQTIAIKVVFVLILLCNFQKVLYSVSRRQGWEIELHIQVNVFVALLFDYFYLFNFLFL